MLISASRRTDIPAFFSDWFFQRLKEKYVLVRHPMNPRRVSRIDLSPDVVDGIVFWTKNPLPMLDRLERLRDYDFYFQFTVTPYGADVEPNVPPKDEVIIPAFRRLGGMLGPDRVIWRYDPIFLSEKYTVDRHAECFEKLAARLEGAAKKCVISFLDIYRHIESRMKAVRPASMTEEHIASLAGYLAESAARHGLTLETCAEHVNLSAYGIGHGRCVDAGLMERLGGRALDVPGNKGQRPACLCSASIDIGAYGTCRHGCVYCYANRGGAAAMKNAAGTDPSSPILCRDVSGNDIVTARTAKTNRMDQLRITE
jgi:hypothetical protein